MIESSESIELSDKIGYWLFRKGLIDKQILEKALIAKKNDKSIPRRNLAQILVQEFNFDHDKIFYEVANIYAFKIFNLKETPLNEKNFEFSKNLLESLPDATKKYCQENRIIPLFYDSVIKDKLIIASIDPTNRYISQIAANFGSKKFEILFISKKDADELYNKIFPPENIYLKMFEDIPDQINVEIPKEEAIDEAALETEINKSALINLVEGALVEGVRRGASDIHFVPKSGMKTEIHFRIDGNLTLWHVQENTYPEAVSSVVKDRSKGLDRFEREKAQDGFIQRNIDNTIIRFRVSVLPTVGTELSSKFESIVIRILDDRKVITDIKKLGFQGLAYDYFLKAINKPQGMVILTGPTGSGKSTTLIAALYQVIDPTVNVLTVEDPVEYVIRGARQLKIGPKMNFEQAIRAILRHDPDIVLVGEMRDKETAEIAIKLANTGHLTFSTLHTNDAPSAVSRLFKMGIEPFLIAYAINIIVAQRLIRKLCTKCKVLNPNYDKEIALAAGMPPEMVEKATFYEAVGCPECNNTGYKGRMAIHEALYFTKEIRNLIVTSGTEIDEDAIRQLAKKNGMLTLRDSGFLKVQDGLTTVEEVIASTTED